MVEVLKSFYLAEWYVDTGTNQLCRGDVAVKLESKVMAVLHYLALHRGELVTRQDLEKAIWGNTVVGYDALTGCIAKLRKVLEDEIDGSFVGWDTEHAPPANGNDAVGGLSQTGYHAKKGCFAATRGTED